ncbi:MAG TPA: aspartate carbamoyltransferase regulatory subunit [Candidatus Faecousia faecipullorum]|uniref:Aspartate carbamoyltransferase regulatory subunit n=1 Tax=Candidatus Avoscillospira stercorigallinarum TaxID=2840708 RepID=A0A9D1CN55_9FIRM|nr:aspartate carbamoyltransferase regulatory subunit [Candidatus Avoscillospira stercorigallinarum]HIS60383.1 aspartate carbamoyltransferase regulatory subunit [Candidatus Faecousia faecipullorum]
MNIDSIINGIVIDHIAAGRGMMLYKLLHLDRLDCSVAIIKNVHSNKMGKKDIIKVDAAIDLNTDVIGYVDPNATVNVIRDGRLVEKKAIVLPERLVNVIRCKNPRCISTTEQELPQVFVLTDREKGVYRCRYCETKAERQG